VIRRGATAYPSDGGHRLALDSSTAALPGASGPLYPLYQQDQERGGTVGINFAVKYCCSRNLDGSYSMEYEILPVSQILVFEHH
jgi:hypothetical protein